MNGITLNVNGNLTIATPSITHRISTGDTDFDWLIFLGRFEPWTRGHGAVAKRATHHTKRLLILEGSHLRPPTLRNPWDAMFREKIIRAALEDDDVDLNRVEFGYIEDFTYRDPLWLEAVQKEVAKHTKPGDKIGLCGWEKDGTSYYLRIFPQWGDHVAVVPVDNDRIVNATDVRNDFWDSVLLMENVPVSDSRVFVHQDLYPSTQRFLNSLIRDETMLRLAKRRKKILADNALRKPVGGMTWDQPAACGDLMATCSGHIALGQRRDDDLWGLFGGHFDSNRKITSKIPHGDTNLFDTALGEGFEEGTFETISRDAMIRSVVDEHFFDDLNRDDRGLYVTRCVHAKLVDRASGLPPLKAGDDMKDARWFAFNDFISMIGTKDHYDIVQFMLARQNTRSF